MADFFTTIFTGTLSNVFMEEFLANLINSVFKNWLVPAVLFNVVLSGGKGKDIPKKSEKYGLHLLLKDKPPGE
jgi:hypothetical protein